jgi:hypothetical protein
MVPVAVLVGVGHAVTRGKAHPASRRTLLDQRVVVAVGVGLSRPFRGSERGLRLRLGQRQEAAIGGACAESKRTLS